MKGELLILFVILLLALILCSFLGGKGCIEGMENNSNNNNSLIENSTNNTSNTINNTDKDKDKDKDKTYNVKTTDYDNYNHYNKTSYPNIFYGPNGKTAKIIQTPNNNTIVITSKNGTTEVYYIDKNPTDPNVSTYYSQNGNTANMITDSSGKQAIQITTSTGSKIVYTGDIVYGNNSSSQDDTMNKYNENNNTVGTDISASTYYGPYGGQATTVTGPAGNTYATYDSSAYYNSLPQGIPKNQIPPGQEDLYILKSQVVPPVCPACPPATTIPRQESCPPCPACARCPEPSFECKKVPNYSAINNDYLPAPVLSDFSQFGM